MNIEIETVTPEKAQEWLKSNNFNRRISNSHVQNLASQMKAGQWQTNGDPIRFNGDGRLLDGQSRLTAIIKSESTIDMVVIRGLSSESFVSIDTGKRRSLADVLFIKGYKYNVPLAGALRILWLWKNKDLSLSASGKNGSYSDILLVLDKSPGIVSSVLELGGRNNTIQAFIPFPFTVFMHHITRKHYPEKFDDFLDRLLSGELLESTNPIYILRERMIKNRQATGAKLNRPTAFAYTVKAWNAFAMDQQISYLRWGQNKGKREEFPAIVC